MFLKTVPKNSFLEIRENQGVCFKGVFHVCIDSFTSHDRTKKRKTSKVLSENRGFWKQEEQKNLGALFTKQVLTFFFFGTKNCFRK